MSAIPAAFSLILSFFTVGTHVHWQDSGFFLTAVREMGILYPPGFVLYLVCCKAWTLLFFFLDFTLAVHLFSAGCAASSVGVLSLACKEMLESRGPLLGLGGGGTPALAGPCAITVGCLAAAGYTFWLAGITAKVYAFYFLILTLLAWRMIRADASGNGRDFTIVAALIGLAWAAHPSATLTGLALLLFVVAHRRAVGAKGIVRRVLLAAATAIGPSLLLPALAGGESQSSLGDPRSVGEVLNYLSGSRFMEVAGVFGYDADRALQAVQYFWEEFLGIGVALVALGVWRISRLNRRLLLGMIAWCLPVVTVTTLFRIEGQNDFWLVAAWLPLYLAAGVGIQFIVQAVGRASWPVLGGIAGTALCWSILLNGPLLNQRNYDLAETYGRFILDSVEPGGILLLGSDDSNAICNYLQVVKGEREDVLLVASTFLEYRKTGKPSWYERNLTHRDPELRMPDYEAFRRRLSPPWGAYGGSDAAFAAANLGRGRPVYFEVLPPAGGFPSDHRLARKGPLFRLVPKSAPEGGGGAPLPMQPEDLPGLFRRDRGIAVRRDSERGVRVWREPYEVRLLRLLLKARYDEADRLMKSGNPRGYARGAELYLTILKFDPHAENRGNVLYQLAGCLLQLGDLERAESAYREALAEDDLSPRRRAGAFSYRGEILARLGDREGAREMFRRALAVPDVPQAFRREIERRAEGR